MANKGNDQVTFRQTVLVLILSRDTTVAGLYRQIRSAGVACSRSSFYEYCDGSTVPGFRTAEQILQALDVAFTPQELEQVLENSVQWRQNYRYQNYGTLRRSVSLPVGKLSRVISGDRIRDSLNRRVRETADSFSDYVARLIELDLDTHILKTRDDHENDE